MKKLDGLLLIIAIIQGCHKPKSDPETGCDVAKAKADNEGKVTITNGVWGTVIFTEGNCMPVILPVSSDTHQSTCKSCPVKRTVQIYEYTTAAQAVPYPIIGALYDRFNTQLIKEVDTDEQGFYQTELPPGKYTIAIKENGKLYANGGDGQGGITPVNHIGGATKYDVQIDYKAYY